MPLPFTSKRQGEGANTELKLVKTTFFQFADRKIDFTFPKSSVYKEVLSKPVVVFWKLYKNYIQTVTISNSKLKL